MGKEENKFSNGFFISKVKPWACVVKGFTDMPGFPLGFAFVVICDKFCKVAQENAYWPK